MSYIHKIRIYVHIHIRSYVYTYVDSYVYFCSCNNSVLFDSLEFLKIENKIKSAFIRVCLLFALRLPEAADAHICANLRRELLSGIAGDFF